MTTIDTTIFETINAKNLTANEVASRFVPSTAFHLIVKRRHSIVVGPRGSGKTTLLKMLQHSALESWNHPEAASFRQAIEFTGIFVPTDLAWSKQLLDLAGGKLDETHHRLFSTAAFTTHVLKETVAAFLSRTGHLKVGGVASYRRVTFSKQQEADLVRQLCLAWKLPPIVPSLSSLKQALVQRMSDIYSSASIVAASSSEAERSTISSADYLHLHILRATAQAVSLFDEAASVGDHKWALLFDELELAPDWIHSVLVNALRSTETDKLLFKLALNPVGEGQHFTFDMSGPSQGHDYDEIGLFYPDKRDSSQFCHSLWAQLLADRSIPYLPPEGVLGHSLFETRVVEVQDFRTAYNYKSDRWKAFKSLFDKDPTFRKYLADHLQIKALLPDTLVSIKDEALRAAHIRKNASLVAFRDFFLSGVGDGDEIPRGRSRKTAAVYSGYEAIFAITEGNPRWFLYLAGSLLDIFVRQNAANAIEEQLTSDPARERGREAARATPRPRKKKTIQRSLQAREVEALSTRVAALLHTIPISNFSNGLLGLLATVGDYFHDLCIYAPFTADPYGSFTVDDGISDLMVAGLVKAINAGALIFVPETKGTYMLNNIRNRRFRLSYLLASLYDTPLRLGDEVSLSTILRQTDERQLDLL